jgi:hypothetical protein
VFRHNVWGNGKQRKFWNPRKTECGAKQFLARLVVRAAPFALSPLLFRFSDFEVRLQELPIWQLVNAELDGNFRGHVL